MSQSLNHDLSCQKKTALFLISQNISLFGSSVVAFTIIWYITLETSSGLWLMLATICSLLPQVVISLWSGVWADRYNRKHLIMLVDGLIALATFLLAIAFWLGVERMELLLAVSVVRSIGTGMQTPAVNAMFPQLVPQDQLARVQGINQTLMSVFLLLSPPVGGFMLGYLGIEWALMLDVFTALIAVTFFSFIQVEKVERASEDTSVFTEMRQGIAYVINNRPVRFILICLGCSYFFIGPAAILTPLLVERSFGGGVWELTANEMIFTIGSLVGGGFIALKGDFSNKVRAVAISLVGFGVTFVLLGIVKHFVAYLAIVGMTGFFLPIIITAQTVLIQENVDPAFMGRVFSLVQIISAGSIPVGILLFGPLADIVSVEQLLLVSGAFLVVVGILYQRTDRYEMETKTSG